MNGITNLMQAAISLVKEAGTIISSNFELAKQIKSKSFGNFVTQVDCEVQTFIRDGIRKIMPDSNFVCEETENNVFRFKKPTWILDPIDGTTNFIHSYPYLSISLALYQQGKGEFGIVYNPITEELFTGIAQKGAFLNGTPLRVSTHKSLDKCIIGFGLPYSRAKSNTMFQVAASVHQKCQDLRRTGSAALDLAYVACGRLDGFLELHLKPWDFAAGIIILKEAGGTVSQWNGEEIEVLRPNEVLATNGLIHNEVKSLIDTVLTAKKRIAATSEKPRRRRAYF